MPAFYSKNLMEIKSYFSNLLKKRTKTLSDKDKNFKAAINKTGGLQSE
jgi:ribonuclease-3